MDLAIASPKYFVELAISWNLLLPAFAPVVFFFDGNAASGPSAYLPFSAILWISGTGRVANDGRSLKLGHVDMSFGMHLKFSCNDLPVVLINKC